MGLIPCLGLHLQEAEPGVEGGRGTPAHMALATLLAPSHLASVLFKAGELSVSQP